MQIVKLDYRTQNKREPKKQQKINKKGEDTDMSVLYLYGYF